MDAMQQGAELLRGLRAAAADLGFSQITVSDVRLDAAEAGLLAWLDAGYHGGMGYMARHGLKRARPAELLPGTLRVISARMDYLADADVDSDGDVDADWRAREWTRLGDATQAAISLYARGRDYHKVLRQRLQRLADWLQQHAQPRVLRVFTDSAPVLEVELAARGGLGWRGKHTLLLRRDAGSMFFLGEIFVDLELPIDAAQDAHCGSCMRCLDVCPTRAIVAPYRLDARRCISYLTIEHDGAIDPALRPLLGNRVYGCDDCQLVCPWNRYARRSPLADFAPRAGLADAELLQLWAWDETQFAQRTEGSPIRRIGWTRWRRNLAVALGNARRRLDAAHAAQPAIDAALRGALSSNRRAAPRLLDPLGGRAGRSPALGALSGAEPLVAEHIDWALRQPPGGDVQAASIRNSGSDTAPSSVDSDTSPAT